MRCPRCRGLVVKETLMGRKRLHQRHCLLCGWDDIPRIIIPREKVFSLRGFAY